MRKLVHLVFGLGIAGLIIQFDKTYVLALLILAIFIGFILSDAISRGYFVPLISDIVNELDRKDALPGKGAIYFAISSLFCLFFFPVNIVVPAIVSLSVLDAIATPVGIRYGKHRIINGKSLEGSLAGTVVTAAVLLVFLPWPAAVGAAVVAGFVELVTPIDDNLLVPLAVCIVLSLFPGMM